MTGPGPDYELRQGLWQDVGADITADVAIFDAPYGARTHTGHNACNKVAEVGFQNGLDYEHFDEELIEAWVEHWHPRISGWIVSMTSHDLIPAWESALHAAGRYTFAPVPYVDFGKGPRVLGDGPASWTVYCVMARPRCLPWSAWGSLPGAYLRAKGDVVYKPPGGSPRIGGKPLGVMRRIVEDYSRPGDTVVDMFGGHFTTALAALTKGRKAIVVEADPVAFAVGKARIEQGYVVDMFSAEPVASEPGILPGFE